MISVIHISQRCSDLMISVLVNVKKCKRKFNIKHRECLHDHPSQRLMIKCLTIIQINWDLEMLVFEERGKPEYPEKNLSEQGREPTTKSIHI